MSEDDVMPDFLGDIMQKFGDVGKPSTAEMAEVDSTGYDIHKMIQDRVCGLLLKDEVTVEEIALLAALLQRPM